MSSPGTPSFRIRPATADDLPGVLRCLGAAFEPYRSGYTRDAFADTVLTPEGASARLAAMHILVAEDESGVVVGTVAWGLRSGSTGHLRGMAVIPGQQGSGVAQALLDRALDELTEAGSAVVALGTTALLQRAIRFYEKNGFRPSGKVSDFFGMQLIEWSRPLTNRRADRAPSSGMGGSSERAGRTSPGTTGCE